MDMLGCARRACKFFSLSLGGKNDLLLILERKENA